MSMTQRGSLTPEDEKRLRDAQADDAAAETVRVRYRQICVEMMGKSSVRTVSALTGLSTNTLQRWKRDASQ